MALRNIGRLQQAKGLLFKEYLSPVSSFARFEPDFLDFHHGLTIMRQEISTSIRFKYDLLRTMIYRKFDVVQNNVIVKQIVRVVLTHFCVIGPC